MEDLPSVQNLGSIFNKISLTSSLDVKRSIEIGDECEFTVEPDDLQMSRMVATRIKHLDRGSVEFDIVVHRDVTGRVVSEPQPPPRRTYETMDSDGEDSNSAKEGAGKVVYDLNGLSLEIPLYFADCENLRDCPRKEDIIKFDINQSKATKETNAVNIRIIESPHAQREAKRGPQTHQGYIAALKDGYGSSFTLFVLYVICVLMTSFISASVLLKRCRTRKRSSFTLATLKENQKS